LVATVLVGLATMGAAATVLVEDWSLAPPGSTGVPQGWTRYETIGGRPAYDFAVVEDEGRRALFLRSRNDHSTIAKPIRVDLRQTPVLEWSWKVITLPTGGDIRKRETSDLTAHVFVIWPRFPAMIRARLIGYVWDASVPAGAIEKSRKTGTVRFFVLRSGSNDLGRWLTERRNVLEDYRRAFGDEPEDPRAVALSIDTNDTHSEAAAFIGRVDFTSAAAAGTASQR
jgi:hypothetical protein